MKSCQFRFSNLVNFINFGRMRHKVTLLRGFIAIEITGA